MNSRCKCTQCGAEKRVDFGACLEQGWPECCGLTMRLEDSPTSTEIAAAVKVRVGDLVKVKADFAPEISSGHVEEVDRLGFRIGIYWFGWHELRSD